MFIVNSVKHKNGEPCFDATDCMSKICSSCSLPKICGSPIGKSCTNNNQCCSLNCVGGKCKEKPVNYGNGKNNPSCIEPGKTCQASKDCCSKQCRNKKCARKREGEISEPTPKRKVKSPAKINSRAVPIGPITNRQNTSRRKKPGRGAPRPSQNGAGGSRNNYFPTCKANGKPCRNVQECCSTNCNGKCIPEKEETVPKG